MIIAKKEWMRKSMEGGEIEGVSERVGEKLGRCRCTLLYLD